MKKISVLITLTTLFLTSTTLMACNNNSTSSQVENYYVINTNQIRSEMLVNSSIELNPTFTNLGENVNPKYKVEIILEEEDVTEKTYDETSKLFSPTEVGSYRISFTVLDDNGEVYRTKDGNSFVKTINIEVVIQSFAPVNSTGPDVTVSDDGVISFGSSYSEGSNDKIDSNQYKVTGVSFEGSYSITYELKDIKYDAVYSDPSLYFGWNKNLNENNDDSIKLSTGNGTMAAWIWDENGNQADLSINRLQGWSKGGWWDGPKSISDNQPISGNHTLTFERYVNEEKNTAVYGIIYDGSPFTYLNVGKNYTDILNNVWVESNNTSGSISVKEYKQIEDNVKPTLELNYSNDYYVGDTINLKNGTTIEDNSIYKSVLTPSYKVFNDKGEEMLVNSGTFTPEVEGTYKVEATVNDLAMNETTSETTIQVKKIDEAATIIDLSETSPVAMPDSGIVLYYTAKKDDKDVAISSIKAYKGDEDVTSTTVFDYSAKTVDNMNYKYFKAPEGNYRLVFRTVDGQEKAKEISVSASNTTVYDFTYFDMTTLIYKDKFIVGKNMIIYLNNEANDKQTVKLSPKISKSYNWTISFDITDLSYSAQGKLFITKNTLNDEGKSIGWEDLSIGGNVKANGEADLWGYECNVLGDGWISYQWRSVWQDPVTTEFMPDPNDRSKGCGREASEYTKYAIGTHNYKIVCEMDNDGKVTYKYYIDNELEVIHRTKQAHDKGNGLDFVQFSGEHMNGIVSNIKIG